MVTSKLLCFQASYRYSSQKGKSPKREKEKGEEMVEAVAWVFIYKDLECNSKVLDTNMNLRITGV